MGIAETTTTNMVVMHLSLTMRILLVEITNLMQRIIVVSPLQSLEIQPILIRHITRSTTGPTMNSSSNLAAVIKDLILDSRMMIAWPDTAIGAG
jgi:hypothetical protein